MSKNSISISSGNSKLGGIPSWSIPPVLGCYNSKFCERRCYARRIMVRRKTVSQAWHRNLELYRKDPGLTERLISSHLQAEQPRYFRIHVGGDFFDMGYLRMWLRITAAHPTTRFLAYTRARPLLRDAIVPSNLNVMLSFFPNEPYDPIDSYPMAFAGEADDHVVQRQKLVRAAYTCPGSCRDCKHCWVSKSKLRNVRFEFH